MAMRSNLPALFLHAIRTATRADLFGYRRPDGWDWISSQEALLTVREVAAGLVARGLPPGGRVGLVSENRPEWIMCDLAIQFAGGVTVPAYPTLPHDQVRYIFNDADVALAIASTADQAEKVNSVRGQLPALKTLISIDSEGEGVENLRLLREDGRRFLEQNPGTLEERLAGLGPDDMATIIYTSGTTGVPKGVVLTQGNLCTNVAACVDLFAFERGDTALSFLPLSHVLERMVQFAYIEMGLGIAYVRSLERLADSLVEVKPHVFVAVPRLLERVAGKVFDQVASLTGAKKLIARRALMWADAAADDFLAGRALRGLKALRWSIADKVVLGRVREKLGGRLKFMISGGAALSPRVARFFWSANIPVFEGYGMTESAPVLNVNYPGHVKLGTVGPAITGVEIRIASDGEILARGPNVMRGYWKLDLDSEQTLRGGWLHTGDLGRIDEDGFLQITGRKKEILVLSTGKNVSPVAIEEALEQSPFISKVIAVGDEKPSVGVLIVPNLERLAEWAAERKLPVDDPEALVAHEQVRHLFQSEISRLQSRLAVFEKARQFDFLLHEPTEQNGLLTPTQKLRRKVVLERYGNLVERMYQ